jgi:Domain of unknown function (DUF4174)
MKPKDRPRAYLAVTGKQESMMSKALRLALAGAVAFLTNGALAMSSLWDNERVFIVFADAGDPRVEAQAKELLAQRDAMTERDMTALTVMGDGTIKPIHGKAPAGIDANALRTRYQVEASAAFTALLIGKDGTVKWREQRPADPGELFALIDTMPMRRQEMKQSSNR